LTGFWSSRQNATGEKLGVEFLKVDNLDYFSSARSIIGHWTLGGSEIRSYGGNIATT